VNDHISDLRWDRLLADELPDDQRTSALAHANGCAACGARYRELVAEQGAFKLRPVGIDFAPKRPSRWWWGAPIGALAAAAVLVLVVTRKPPEGERTKGADKPALLLSAGRPGALVPMMANDAIRPGDSLQAGYTAKTDGFGAVLALDGANQAMTYVPASGDVMVALPAGTDRSFPSSTVLDNVLGKETIALVWCEVAQPLAPLIAELRSTKTLGDRDRCTIRIVVLDKAAR